MANVTLVPVEEESAVLVPVEETGFSAPMQRSHETFAEQTPYERVAVSGSAGQKARAIGAEVFNAIRPDATIERHAGRRFERSAARERFIGENIVQPIERLIGTDASSNYFLDEANKDAALAKQINERTDKAYPVTEGTWQGALKSAVESIDDQLPGMVAGGITAGGAIAAGAVPRAATRAATAISLIPMGENTGALSYEKYRQRGVGAGSAIIGSGVESAIEMTTELLPAGKLFEMMEPAAKESIKKLVKLAGQHFAGEQLGESLATLGQDVTDKFFSRPDMTTEQRLAAVNNYFKSGEATKNWLDTMRTTAVQSILMEGGVGAVNRARNKIPAPDVSDINIIKGTDERNEIAAAIREQSKPIASPAPVEQRPPEPIMDSEAATPEDQEIMAMQQENELYRQQQLMDKADIPVIQEKEPEIPTSFRSADGKSNVRTKRLDDGTYEVSTTSVDEYGNKKTFAKKMTAKEADEHINKLMPEPMRDEYLKVNAPEVKEEVAQPELPVAEPVNPDVATFQPILDSLTAQTGVQVNKSGKGFSTTSDFQMALKEGWPTVRKGIESGSFEKSEVIKALKNITEGKRLGAAQQRVIDAFREDIARYEEVTAEQETQDAAVEAELQAEREAMQAEGGDTSFEFGEKREPSLLEKLQKEVADYEASLPPDEKAAFDAMVESGGRNLDSENDTASKPLMEGDQSKLFPTPPTFGKKPQGKGSVTENPMLTEMKEREAESKQETISFSQNTGGANGRSFEGKVVGANSTSASKQLEDALSKDGFNIARGSYEQLEVVGKDAEALQALTASLGRELVFIRRTPNGRLRNTPNPFAMSDGRTIYINYENNKQLLFLLGHELIHTIARNDPEVYAKLKQVVIKYTDMAGAKRSYLASNMLYRNVSEDLVTEEVVGNLMGEYFNDPKFWKEVAKDKSFFEKMRSIVEAVLEKASEILNGYTAHFVKDIDAVRKAMAEAVVESAKSQSKSGGQVRFAQTVPRISEAKQRAHSVLDSLKAFVNNPGGLGKLPSQLQYLARRYRVLGTISEINDLTADWGKAFKGATKEENAAIYDYLTTKDADPLLVPEKFRKKAVEGKQMVIDIGEKLVAYGILSESVFEKNKGEYLPRVYLKFLIGEDTARVLGTGKKLDLNYLKSRKDIPEDVRRLILGEVKDPGFLLSKAFSIPSRDMALIDWLTTISQNQEWVMPKSLIEWSMSENPSRDLGRINYRQNDDGTYNLTITEVKTVETKHKGIKTADLQTFLGNDKIAAYIAAGKGKPVLRKTEVNGKAVYKPTPWKKVGRIQYKIEPDGTMTFKLKERVTSKKTHDNVTDSQLDQLAGKRADGIRNGEGKAENSQVMTPWHLAAEAERLQKQIDYMPAEDRKEAEEVARRMRKAADAAIKDLPISSSDVPENFKQMPDSPKYGALRGLIVRREIYDDIVGSVNVSIGDQSAMEKLLGSNGTVSKLTGMWKWAKVSANPPAQVRNFVSNMVLLDLSGVNTLMVPVRIAQAAKEISTNGKHWQIAKSYGVKEATFSNTEMVRINEELVRILAKDKAGWPQIYQWAKFLASWGVNRTSDLYQFMESVGKTAKIIDEMTVKRNHGTFGKPDVRVSTAEEAAMEAHKWLFDYSLVSRNTKYLRNAPIGVPFMTFLTKIAPRLIEVAVKKPWRFTPYATLAYGLPYWIAGMLDIDDDDYEKIMAALPEWIREKQHVYLLPWKDEQGRWQAMDLGYYFPWTAWTTMGEGVIEYASGEKDFSEASSKVGQGLSVGGPLSDLIAASKTGIDPFTQRKIVDKYADPSEQVAQVFGYLYQMAMPPFLTQRGTAGKLYSALTNELGKDRLPKATEAQAALSTVGMNLYGYDANMTRAQSIKRMQFDVAELKRQAKSELSNPNLSEAEKDELRGKFREKIQRMNNKMLKYAKSSMPSQKELLKRETQ